MPAVSVIIAAYNCSAPLRLAIRSVLNQTFGDFELWVVGDRCTDDSAEAVAAAGDPRVHWVNLPEHSGSQSEPNNEGLRRAAAPYIAYLGQDDLWLPTHLAALVSRIESTGASLVHALGARIGPEGVLSCIGALPSRQSYRTFHVPPSGWLHRRDVIDAAGFWPDHRRLSCGVDGYYFQRIARTGNPIAFSPELTMLKFPAARFSIYAVKGRPPQADYLEAMERDLPAFRERLLTDLAMLSFRREPVPLRRLAVNALKHVMGHVSSRLPQRQRASAVARFQRRRRRALVAKGLPPTADGNP